MDDRKFFKYLCTQRPAGPGAVPTRGLIRIEDGDKWKIGYWSLCYYDRRLSAEELRAYEMVRMYERGDKAVWRPKKFPQRRDNITHPWYNHPVAVLEVEANQFRRLKVRVLDAPETNNKTNFDFWAEPEDLIEEVTE